MHCGLQPGLWRHNRNPYTRMTDSFFSACSVKPLREGDMESSVCRALLLQSHLCWSVPG